MTHVPAFGATSPTSVLEHMLIGRRAVGAQDVQIQIEFCGVCHTDIHMVRDDWGGSNYPVVPGHEVVGKVTSVGADVLDL